MIFLSLLISMVLGQDAFNYYDVCDNTDDCPSTVYVGNVEIILDWVCGSIVFDGTFANGTIADYSGQNCLDRSYCGQNLIFDQNG